MLKRPSTQSLGKQRPKQLGTDDFQHRSRSEDESESDGCDMDFDCSVWRLRPRVRNRSGRGKYAMPAVQAWAWPPAVKGTDHPRRCKSLATIARKVFACAGNAPFWISAQTAPKTELERFALDVFWFHVKRLGWTPQAIARLGRAAGAEFWVQRRVATQPIEKRGVNWHFDKDEDLLDDSGLYVHPLVGTATYLTSRGAPLVVLSSPTLRCDEDGAPQLDVPQLRASRSNKDAFISFPVPGLHVAFRGNLLHGAPPFLEVEKGERLNILLNVWLRHRPLALQRCQFTNKRCSASTTMHGRLCPGRAVRIRCKRRAKKAVANSLSLTPDVGDWSLEGLHLPRDLPGTGVWKVPQTTDLRIEPDQKTKYQAKRKRSK